jgi:hypothetical protein
MALWNFNDRTALLAPVRSGAIVDRFQFLEFIAPLARSLETFRTIAVPQLLAVDRQMAMPAPHCSLSYQQQFERSVITRSHDSKNDFAARNVMHASV